MRSSPLYSVPGSRIAAAIAVGTVVSMVAGRLILEVVSFGWFSLWAGFLVGTGLGELFLRLMARRRGVVPETVTGVCTAVGMLLSFLVFVAYPGFPRNPALFAALIRHYVMYFLCAGISVATAVARIKYI